MHALLSYACTSGSSTVRVDPAPKAFSSTPPTTLLLSCLSSSLPQLHRPVIIGDMGKLETEARRKRRKGYIQSALLAAIGISGLIVIGAAAPNTLRFIEGLVPNKHKFSYRVRGAAARLAKKGDIRFVERGGKKYLEITEQGKQRLAFEQGLAAVRRRAVGRWDGRWRMVVFDIPETRRRTRLQLRTTLRSIGFVQLQASVWVYPYDCEEVVMLLKAELKTGAKVLYAIVEKIEFDQRLRQYFKL